MNISEEEKETMRKLFEDNGLSKDDVFKHKHYIIIKRSGIQKIQYKNNIRISYEVINSGKDFCIVKATGKKDNQSIETLASATPENATNKHYVEMAEKRAMSRVVLKLMNLYEFGVFGEDENLKDGLDK